MHPSQDRVTSLVLRQDLQYSSLTDPLLQGQSQPLAPPHLAHSRLEIGIPGEPCSSHVVLYQPMLGLWDQELTFTVTPRRVTPGMRSPSAPKPNQHDVPPGDTAPTGGTQHSVLSWEG